MRLPYGTRRSQTKASSLAERRRDSERFAARIQARQTKEFRLRAETPAPLRDTTYRPA